MEKLTAHHYPSQQVLYTVIAIKSQVPKLKKDALSLTQYLAENLLQIQYLITWIMSL